MSEATESSGTVKIVTFSGKTDTWDNWEFGFMCRAVLHGYDGILLGDVTAPTQVDFQAISVDTTDTAAKKTRKLYRYNSIAFSHLVSSMDASKEACHVPIGILKTARTTELPGGDAYKGFKALQDHYFNKSVASIQALVKEYTRKTLTGNQDPAEYIYEMENLRAKILAVDKNNSKMEDSEFVLNILNTLPFVNEPVVGLAEAMPFAVTQVNESVLEYSTDEDDYENMKSTITSKDEHDAEKDL